MQPDDNVEEDEEGEDDATRINRMLQDGAVCDYAKKIIYGLLPNLVWPGWMSAP